MKKKTHKHIYTSILKWYWKWDLLKKKRKKNTQENKRFPRES